ncbi:MAG: hypothetical protein MJA28_06210 [Gammaproteobacteria bacterium]|nr:hypothetical protein [Gammaproteobacteria bacterium]
MLLKLSEYDEHYRPKKTPRSLSTLRRQAAGGKIPGAFQMSVNGSWWVDTIEHDKVISENVTATQTPRAANDAAPLSQTEQQFIQDLVEKLA